MSFYCVFVKIQYAFRTIGVALKNNSVPMAFNRVKSEIFPLFVCQFVCRHIMAANGLRIGDGGAFETHLPERPPI